MKAATQQLAPVYAQQEQAISSQVPAIQNLYNTLIQGLEQSSAQQLESGVSGIVEDASRRGVLRSTLPVDARQNLQTQLSQALLQGRGQLESQRMGDIAGINEKLGGLRVQRAGNIADLARALESNALEKRRFAFQKAESTRNFRLQRLQANRDYQLKQQQLAQSRSSGGGGSTRATPQWALTQQAFGAVDSYWKPGTDGFVNPAQWNKLRSQWRSAGLKVSDFDNQYADLINPAHFQYTNLPQYQVSTSLKNRFQ